ncbi:hypothetical protein LY76DRAFT_359390 [Colletotrichum caudatum]|nr:hypothetical protein LY76DRAFT_359390 [Colletotrichum caudatum]
MGKRHRLASVGPKNDAACCAAVIFPPVCQGTDGPDGTGISRLASSPACGLLSSYKPAKCCGEAYVIKGQKTERDPAATRSCSFVLLLLLLASLGDSGF